LQVCGLEAQHAWLDVAAMPSNEDPVTSLSSSAALQQGEDADYVKLMTRLLDVAIGRQYFKEYCKER
jgi:hypothetical protein